MEDEAVAVLPMQYIDTDLLEELARFWLVKVEKGGECGVIYTLYTKK